MVAIVTGAGYGLERSSAFVLGSQGQVGQSKMGRLEQDVFVNAATGLLNIGRTDEVLIGKGPDQELEMQYYSGISAWRQDWARCLFGLSGTVNTAGSVITFVKDFNDRPAFYYDVNKGAYISKEGGGAYDRINFADGKWSFTDGDTQVTDFFEHQPAGGVFYISRRVDADGFTQSYEYPSPTSSMVSKITNADGNYTEFTYAGARPSSIKTTYTNSAGGTSVLTRVRYEWDPVAGSRLNRLIVDRTPEDNSITDGDTYVTEYGYDSAGRVNSISQTDGSLLGIVYDGAGKVWKLTQTAATGDIRLTTLTYFTGYTEVTDAQGGVTKLVFDALGQLTQLTTPAAVSGGTPQTTSFGYNPNGDVTSSTNAAGTTVYQYDENGNQTLRRDPLGNSVSRAYNSRNQLLRETVYLTPDPDGDLAGVPSAPLTTRYVYDTSNHLRYVVSGDGRVTYLFYNGSHQLSTKIEYRAHRYDVSALTPAQDIAYATMSAWSTAITDFSQTRKTAYTYDFRGNLQSEWSFGITAANSNGITDSDSTLVNYVYDQAGKLLSRKVGNQPAETFVYDGMGRVIASTDPNANATSIFFNDSANTTVVTLANGLTQTSVYNRAGELVGYMESSKPNILPNPTLAQGTDGWTLTNARRIEAAPGSPVPYVFTNGTVSDPTGQGVSYSPPNKANLPAGTSFNLSYSFKPGTAGSQFRVGVEWYDSAGASVGSNIFDEFPTDTASFTTKEYIVARPGNAAKYLVYVYSMGTAAGNQWGGLSLAPASTAIPGLSVATYQYDSLGRMRISTDPSGVKTWHVYDRAGRKMAEIGHDYSITEYAYNADNLLVRTIRRAAPLNNTQITALLANPTGIELSTLSPAGHSDDRYEWRVYDSANRLIGTIDGAGSATQYIYDGASRLISTRAYATQLSAGTVDGFKINSPTNLNGLTANNGIDRVSRNFYDKDGLLIGSLDGEGFLTRHVYDGGGLKTETVRYARAADVSLRPAGTLWELLASVTANLAFNPATVDGKDGWTLTNATLVAGAPGDAASYYFQHGGVTGQGWAQTQNSNAPAGTTFYLSFRAKPAVAGTQVQVGVVWLDSNSVEIGTTAFNGFPTDTTAFTTFEQQITKPANAAKYRVYMWTTGGSIGGVRLGAESVTASPAHHPDDIREYSLYDNRGVLRATIDGEGGLTRYRYANLSGFLDQEVRGQKLDPAALLTAAPRWNTLPTYDVNDVVIETTSYARNNAGDVTTETRTLAGGTGETTTFTYDKLRKLLATTVNGVSDVRTYNHRYDSFGRLIGELPGEGNAALAALGGSPAVAAVDTVYLTWGKTYSYDSAGRLASMTTPNGTDANANRTLFYYDSDDRLRYEINAKGEVVEHRYNALGDRTDTILYAARIGSTELAKLKGGVSLIALAAVTASPTLDSRTHIDYNLNGTVKQSFDAVGYAAAAPYATTYSYNAFRDVSGRVDPFGDSITVSNIFDYDRRGLLKSETRDSAAGGFQLLTSFGYDAFGRRTSETDPDLKLRKTEYDRAGRVAKSIGADNKFATFTYDARGNMLTSTDRAGKTTEYSYTRFNRTVTMTTPEGLTTTSVRNAHGETLSITDHAGRAVTYGYDKSGNLKTVTDAAGQHLNNYDKAGRLFEEIDARGVKTSYGYDSAARMLSREVDDGAGRLNLLTTWEYDAKGRRIRITDPTLTVTRIDFDLNGQRTAVVADEGGLNLRTEYSYDRSGRQLTVTEGAGTAAARVTTFDYDMAGRVIDCWVDKGGLNLRTHYLYDKRGNVTNVTDAAGNVTVYTYDDENRQVLAADAEGRVTRTSYDAEGRVTATRRYASLATLATTGTNYGIWKYQISATPSDSSSDEVKRHVYDGDGRLRFSIDALGHPCQYEYDGSGNLVRKTEYAGTIAYVATDTVATLQGKVAGLAARTTRAYFDTAGRQTFAIDAAGGVTGYSYDANSNVVKSIAYKNAYSGADTIAAVQTWAGQQALADARIGRTIYDGAARAVYEAVEAGALGTGSYVTEYRYDAAGRVEQQIRYADKYSVTDSTSQAGLDGLIPDLLPATAARTLYAYDDAGRLTDVTDAENVRTRFVLDATGLITDTIVADGTADASTTHRAFDKGGRVVDETRGFGTTAATTSHFVYDGVGRAIQTYRAYQSSDESKTVRVFDSAGRIESETRGHGTADASTTVYDWDELGNLETETDGRSNSIVRTYDLAGRMLTETVPIDAGSSAVTRKYYDSFGNVARLEDPRGNSGYFYYDGMNRLTLQVDPEGYVTKTTYTAGGEVGSVTRYAARATGTWSEATLPTINADALKDSTTLFARDRLDRLTGITDAENFTESYTLDAFGNRVEVRNKLHGSVVDGVTLDTTVFFSFDRLGRVLSETLPVTTKNSAGTTISVKNSYQYDARGNRIRTIEAEGAVEARTTKFEYDRLDRLTKTEHDAVTIVNEDLTSTSGIVPTEQTKYDRRGNVIETIDAAGARILYWYDDLDRAIAQVVQSEKSAGVDRGTLTRTGFDANGNATSVKTYGDLIALPADSTGAIPAPVVATNYRLTNYSYYRDNRLKETIVAGLTTGQWNNSSYALTPGTAGAAAEIRTLIEYDKAGNVVHKEDGRGNDVWSWYDKLGRKTAQVDADNYLTVWVHDAEGHATSETRYATRLAPFTPGTSPPTVAPTADDRITEYRYDRNGRCTQEQRLAVAHSRIDPATGAATDYAAGHAESKSTITFSYNGLGQVLTRTEWSGAATNSYDAIGRLTLEAGQSFTDHLGNSVAPRTAHRYDGLNNIVSIRLQASPVANDTNDRITTFSYGAGGRLATMTDATGFAHSYGYDAAGRVVRDSYTRLKADGVTSLTEAQVTRYDLAGRAVTQTNARLSGTTWVFTDLSGAGYDAVRIRYNAFGEMSGRGLTAGPAAAAVYQEVFDYDSGGRLWRTNAGDGVLRFHVYDKAGNRTLTLKSTGADLSALGVGDYVNSIDAAGDTGIANAVTTVSLFDASGRETGSREPDRQLSAGVTAVVVRARSYNAFGEVASETDPRGFDSSGNALGTVANFTTNFTYNTMGRLVSKVSPLVSVTSENGTASNANPTEYYGYDLSGRLVSITDANGHRTTRQLLAGSGRDGSDPLVTKEFHPDTGIAETKYDVFGDARALINEVDSTELRDYDKLGRLTVQYHPTRAAGSYGNTSGGAVQLIDYFTYDGLGRRTRHWNSQLGAAELEKTDYDIRGRIVSTTLFGGDTMAYTYAWNASQGTAGLGTFGGWTKSTVNPASRTMSEAQDYFGRTVDRVDFGFHDYDFAFDLGGRLVGRSSSAGESVAFTYYGTGLISGQTGTQGVAAYGYDSAGNRTKETFSIGGVSHRNATATYDSLNRMTAWSDAGFSGVVPASSAWEYDKVGNVRYVHSAYRILDAQGAVAATDTTRDYWFRYDEMNRFTLTKGSLAERGSGSIEIGSEGTEITHYLDGNRRTALFNTSLPGKRWAYFATDEGGHQLEMPYDGQGTGVWLEVNDGFFGKRLETFYYSADGYLAKTNKNDGWLDHGAQPAPSETPADPIVHDPVGAGSMISTSTLDAMGRTIYYKEIGGFDGTFERLNISYDNAGRLLSDKSVTVRRNTQGVLETYNSYQTNTYTNGLLSRQEQDVYKNGDVGNSTADTAAADSVQDYTYSWWDGALQYQIKNDKDYGGNPNNISHDWTTTFSYGSSGHVTSASIQDGRPRTVSFLTDQNGMIVDRDEVDSLSTGDPRTLRYYFGGMQFGQTGNNGSDNMSYAGSIKDRLSGLQRWETGGGAFHKGSTQSTPYADFEQSYDAINGYSTSPTGSAYTVNGGENLAMIAQNVWGDSQLWYLIASANGLSGSEQLVSGQVLTIPNKVHNSRNAADTFRVYDPNEAIGDTSPVDAKPAKKNKCAVVGTILLIAIAVAVTVVTSGAALAAIAPGVSGIGAGITALATGLTATGASVGAGAMIAAGAIGGAIGSIVSQSVGVATGLQDKFNWKGVAMSALSGAVSAGVSAGASGMLNGIGSFARGALTAGASSAASQGIGVATGLQQKFDWVGVAAAAIGGGVSAKLGKNLSPLAKNRSLGNILSHAGVSVAGASANAAVRTALTNTGFDANLMAALPDAIGSTLGNLIGNSLAERPAPTRSIDWDGDTLNSPFEERDSAAPDPVRLIQFSNGASRPYNILVDPIEFPRLDPIELDLGGLDLGPLPDPALAANSPRAEGARRGWAEFRENVARARDPEGIRNRLKGEPSTVRSVSARQPDTKGFRDIPGGRPGDTSLIGGVLTFALARNTNDDVMGWLFENGLFVEGFTRNNISKDAETAAISRMVGEASDFQLRGGIAFFTSMSDAPVYGGFAAKAANALADERQRRLNTPEAQAAEREVRKVDMFFGGIIAAWTAPLSVPLITEGGLAAGIGYLSLASSANHAASATAPFTGIDRPLLDHFTVDGATTVLDVTAGVAGLTYGTVRTGQAVWNWNLARRGDGLSDFTRRYLTESGGRWGGTSTRHQNYGISQELERRGYRVSAGGGIAPEEHIAGPGGRLAGGSFVDITSTAPGGQTVRIQTVTTLRDGVTPTPSEAAAAARIRAAFPKDRLLLVPKTGK